MTVEIFTDCNFSGTTSGALNQDYAYIGDFWNDKISSIKVYSGTWEFFEHANYQGSSFRVQPGSYPTLNNGWNDVVSSLKQVGQETSPAPAGSGVAQKILDLTNLERSQVGAPALTLNAQLMAAAQAHTNLMAQRNQMSHQLPGEPAFGDRFLQAGYRWSAAAENVAAGQQTPEAVMQSWMTSPGHRQNLLNPAYRELGVGYANHFWTQAFGSR
jgi:uncharacterized protein YkwD